MTSASYYIIRSLLNDSLNEKLLINLRNSQPVIERMKKKKRIHRLFFVSRLTFPNESKNYWPFNVSTVILEFDSEIIECQSIRFSIGLIGMSFFFFFELFSSSL